MSKLFFVDLMSFITFKKAVRRFKGKRTDAPKMEHCPVKWTCALSCVWLVIFLVTVLGNLRIRIWPSFCSVAPIFWAIKIIYIGHKMQYYSSEYAHSVFCGISRPYSLYGLSYCNVIRKRVFFPLYVFRPVVFKFGIHFRRSTPKTRNNPENFVFTDY